MTENLKSYNNQINEDIDNDPKFDNSGFNLSSNTGEPLPVVTVSLRGGKKHRAIVVAGITCLCDSGSTNIMIKIKHNKHYESKMRSNRVEYRTADGVYCTNHDVKVPFCISEFLGSKIINHRFHVDNNKDESGIGYAMIIGRDLMVQLGLTADFKRQPL